MAYYDDNLSGEQLRRCYDLAPPLVRRYLAAEIDHIVSLLHAGDEVLELGCGYGRVALKLVPQVRRVVGIDTATGNIALARKLAGTDSHAEFHEMDASALSFPDASFDAVVCPQNGICAFGVDRERLVGEAARVCRPGGQLVFSSYAEQFWPHRLEWFELQAADGMMGAIDHEATGDGVIVCEDGFRAGFMSPDEFHELWSRLGFAPNISTVDGSATFCTCTMG